MTVLLRDDASTGLLDRATVNPTGESVAARTRHPAPKLTFTWRIMPQNLSDAGTAEAYTRSYRRAHDNFIFFEP